MTTPKFPLLPSGNLPDSSKFELSLKDSTVRKEMEGGYTVTRRRTTRRPRATFKVAFTAIPELDRKALFNFWSDMGGQAKIFEWISPQDGVTYLVRFKGEQMSSSYVGRGATQLWNCSFDLEQA